jgi:hypothetical protein
MRTFENKRNGHMVSFDKNGLSKNVELNILNVQPIGRYTGWEEVRCVVGRIPVSPSLNYCRAQIIILAVIKFRALIGPHKVFP